MDIFEDELEDLEIEDSPPSRRYDWWTHPNELRYLNARREDLDFVHQGQSDSTGGYDTNSTKKPPPPVPPSTHKLEVQERWFIVPKAGVEGSLFGIEPPGLDTAPPPEALYAFIQPKRPNSPNPYEVKINCQELVANINPIAAGLYNLLLRVKADEPTSVHLVVHVKVKYDAERGVRDTVYSKLRKDSTINEPGWHYLVTENQIEVRPHHGLAWVNIRIMRDEKSDHPFQGKLWTRSLELVPIGQDPVDAAAKRHITRVVTPDFTTTTNRENERGVIARLAHSKDGNYLAALRLLPNSIVVQVWRKDHLENHANPEKSTNVGTQGASFEIDCVKATKAPKDESFNVQDLSLGMTISASGDQIAVYQTPRIGDWKDGTLVPTADFGFHLFRNPLANREAAVQMKTVDGEVVAATNALAPLEAPAILDKVGYASYVGEYEDDGGSMVPPKFVFCDGFYLDVFEVHSNGLEQLHTISLQGLTPTVSRRFACETTMGSICENMFLWAEDGGRYCSTWDLFNGSAIKRLETSRWRYDNVNSKTKMSIARSQHIVAVVGFDNSITTFFADSGIQISSRRFTNQRIEFIGFASNQSTELFVVLRERSQEEFSTRMLDPLRLEIEVETPTVPIPIRSTIFCHFGLQKGNEIGVVCQPEADGINFFHLKEPGEEGRKKEKRKPLKKPDTIISSTGMEFTLMTRKPNTEDAPLGTEEAERLVELFRVSGQERIPVFSFVPEPWEQQAPSKAFFLPTGDRFVAYGARTIQVWSLPTEKEPCKLLYFWSLYQPKNIAVFNKTEMEVILTEHKKFTSANFFDCDVLPGHTRLRVNVVPTEKKGGSQVDVKPVELPNSPMRRIDHRNTAENCFQSIRLLALAYSIVASGYEETQDIGLRNTSHETHTMAILNFINQHINHTNYQERISTSMLHGTFYNPTTEKQLITIWTHFLTAQYLPGLCAKLIIAILGKDDCAWIPRKYESINPILVAIERKNSAIVEAFIDFCVKKATEKHPAYMLPVVQSFSSLVNLYPEILKALLKKSSHIPAQNMDFHQSHVTISGFDWRPIIGSKKKRRLEEFAYPVFSHHLIVLKAANDRRTRIDQFPTPQISSGTTTTVPEPAPAGPPANGKVESIKGSMVTTAEIDQSVEVPYDNRIYVAPFPRLSMYGMDRKTGQNKGQSQFSYMAGKDFFDNPAMMAVLRFKWWMYGFWYWFVRFVFLLFFYGIFAAVTIQQMTTASDMDVEDRTASEMLQARYMDPHPWKGLIALDLALGAVFLFLELFQLHTEGLWLYIMSLFNWVDVISIILTMACQLWVLIICVKAPEDRDPEGPERIHLIWFAVIAMYLHLLFELRVYQPLGIIVNIIIRITRRIAWFFIIFAIMIVGFTHALIHVLYTSKPVCKPADNETETTDEFPNCKVFGGDTAFPSGFLQGLSGTLFFLAGRYDFVEDNFATPDLSFHLLMIIFYFFTGLVLLNVLIALMNDAYNQCSEEGQLAWLKQWSKVLDEVEMIFLRHFQTKRLRHLFPDYIYYAAPIQDADAYRAQLMITDKASLSSENFFMHESNMRQNTEMKKKLDTLEEQLKKQVEVLREVLEREGVRIRSGSYSSFASGSSSPPSGGRHQSIPPQQPIQRQP